jgi:hypothetical protein
MRWRKHSLDWSLGSTEAYWDPTPWVSRLQGERLNAQWTPIRPAGEIFQGKWEERNWRNVPGPIYGAMTDNCWVGRLSAPRHVLYGDDENYEQEFLYRQPKSLHELLQVLDAAQQDPWAGWACDGDQHWTVDSVREWWRNRLRLKEWIDHANAQEDEVLDGLRDYRGYIDGPLEVDLRRYCYWLTDRRSPAEDQALPDL